LRSLPPNVTWTCRIPRNAVLYKQAPPPTGKRGRPRLKGDRPGSGAQIAAAAEWATHQVPTYSGKAEVKHIARVAGCLWYGSFHTTLVTVVLALD